MTAPALRPFHIRPWMVVLLIMLVYMSAIYVLVEGSIYGFILPKQTVGQGYDGQFTYYVARNPLGAPALIAQLKDLPAYRIQRIFHPVLAGLFSFGQEPLIPWAMFWTALAGLLVGVAALEELLADLGVSRWHALTYGLFSGVWIALRVTTTESLAFGLVLWAILAERRGKPWMAAILLGLAALTKEPTLFFVAGYLLYYASQRQWRDAIRLAVVAIGPFVVWQFILFFWLGAFGIGSGGAGFSSFEVIPFAGLLRIGETAPAALIALGIYAGLITVPATLFVLVTAGHDLLRRRWHPYVFLAFCNAAIIPFIPFSTFREPLGIARFLPGLVLSFILYAALRVRREESRRPLVYATFWVFLGLRLIG